ncbi:AI-2E family transporter [Leptolyngbyaceae cyanobacterium CCMR0082]|uniref:AI-2E family transporter n=2 Tax=Adonisia turfae TaxID=2950184 RepID=A0A6M0S325_9CYAN|nr:AI-2E family transporter [Leptothoe sp. LEGE 181152]NEZ55136.1 AI-2E family transporter [Adonisia turfae CCMR0081]NEZ62381.1 AI-2E family transporter [Adonisia turfae CCMR0082]
MKLGEWIGLISILATFYILWALRAILLLVFMAVVLAIALNSFARRVQKTGVPRRFAVPLVLTSSFLVVTLFLVLVVPPFVAQFELLIALIIDAIRELPETLAQLETYLPDQFRLPELEEFINWATSPDSALLNAFNNLDIFNNFFTFFNSSLRVLLQFLLVLILSLMFLGNPTIYRNTLLRLIPSFYRRRADGILQDCEIALCNWMGGIVLNSVFIFSLSFVGLWVLQIKFVLTHALLAGVLNFIPNVGPSISVIFPAMVALQDPTNPLKIVPVIIWYVIIQQIESYWLTPTVMARQISLPPAFTLISQICFAFIFGFLGLVLALPLAVVAKIWLQELVIKDILDQWEVPNFAPWKVAVANGPDSPESLLDQPEPFSGITPDSNEEVKETGSPINNG